MDLSAAFANGYNVGKDLGYHISGQAAEDIRLNREATRAKINAQNLQNDIMQQQAQYVREDREEQEKMKAYEGVALTTTNAIQNPLMKPQALQAIRQFQQNYGYSQEWAITDALDDDTKDEEQFKARSMIAYTVHGKGTNPLDEQNADDFQRVQQGMIKMTNTQTGETQYAHIGDLLYMFGGNYGAAYMHSVIQAKKLKEAQEAQKAQIELNKTVVDTQATQNKMVNDNIKTQIEAEKLNIQQQEYNNAQKTSNYLANLHQQDPSRSISTDGKGHITGVGATKDGSDGQQLTIDNIADSQYQQARLAFEQSNGLTPQQVGTHISHLRQLARQEKLTDEQFKEIATAASKYVEKALQDGNNELAIEYQQVINSALELKVDDNAKQALQLYESANEVFKDVTSNDGQPTEAFFDAFGGYDKLRNFFSALTGIIDIDQEAVFDSLNRTKNLQSLIAYDMMGKRISKHGLAQLPLINEWLTGTANLSVIRAHLDRVKAKAKADMIAGDPKLVPWAKETYRKIEQFQKQIDDNIAFAQVIEGKQKMFSSKFINNEIVKPGGNLDEALKTRKNVISFKTLGEAGDKNKQVNIYLSTDRQNPLQMSISDFNKITLGKYFMHTKDIR